VEQSAEAIVALRATGNLAGAKGRRSQYSLRKNFSLEARVTWDLRGNHSGGLPWKDMEGPAVNPCKPERR
jgi:hypothetical protein